MNLHNSIAGLLVGFLVGSTGMGGASLMAPILIFLFHYKARYAVGSDLAYAAISKWFGAWKHHGAGTVNLDLVFRLSLGSVPASLLGVWLMRLVNQREGEQANAVITRMIGAVLVLVALVLIARSFPQVEAWIEKRQKNQAQLQRSFVWTFAVGAIGGFLVGLTSVGAGTLFGVSLLLVFGLGAREMVGTDLYHAALLSSFAALGHVWAQDVDYPLVGSLLIGAIPGVLFGSHVSTRLPEKALRPTLATVLLLTGLRILL